MERLALLRTIASLFSGLVTFAIQPIKRENEDMFTAAVSTAVAIYCNNNDVSSLKISDVVFEKPFLVGPSRSILHHEL